jgi:hypothetical protein
MGVLLLGKTRENTTRNPMSWPHEPWRSTTARIDRAQRSFFARLGCRCQPRLSPRRPRHGLSASGGVRQCFGERIATPQRGSRKRQATLRSRHSGQVDFVLGVTCHLHTPCGRAPCAFVSRLESSACRAYSTAALADFVSARARLISTSAPVEGPFGWHHLAVSTAPFGNRA